MAFMGTESASSSSSSSIMSGFKYDVFLSFRGSDTRKNFTDHLYAALNQKGIFTFRDDEKLERGTFIAPELLRAIEESRFAVVIISQNYASSSWCLIELAKIVECMEKERLIVLPVFHYIDPSDVRNLKETFGEAFAKHEERCKDNIEEVYRWKAALTQVAKIAGWDLRDKHEANVVEEIVRKISNKLISTYSIVHKDLVGINSRMGELVNLLGMGLNDVRFIGIWGMGGLGKTTLARVVYDRFRHRFEGSSFLANVREECEKLGLVHLQKQLLFDILIERNLDFSNVQEGSYVIYNRLRDKSVLIVLDDVDQLYQLKALAGERTWFGQGSRVIITTRDQHLLIEHDVAGAEIYKAKELSSDEALQHFSRKAFKKDHPLEGYVELSKKAVCYAQGLPLALDVLGTFLKHRSPDAWESALDRLEETPQKKVLDTLRISFDGLEETEKKIFLDIACFFKGEDKDHVTNILRTPCYKPSIDINVLVEKSLITILGGNLWMHDLLQELGRQIVHNESPEQPSSRSRLWRKDDVLHVLKNCTGSNKIRGIMLRSPYSIEEKLHTEAFKRMENLKFLVVENVHIRKPFEFLPSSLILLKWPHYPFNWPPEFLPKQLASIEMPCSRIRFPKLIKQEYRLENLIDVNLKGCELIEKLPELWAPNLENLNLVYCIKIDKLPKLWAPNLGNLYLAYCKNLVEIDESYGSLEKLRKWNLSYCPKLQFLPSQLKLKSLDFFDLTGCSRLEKLPNFHPEMECLKTLYLGESGIRELPSSIKHLTKLEKLVIGTAKLRPTCNSINSSSGYEFVNMDFEGYETIIELDSWMKPDYFPALEAIYLFETDIVTIPESISGFRKLKSLYIRNCKLLRKIQGLPQSISKVRVENCMLLDTQSPSGLLSQVIKIIGISPSRVCGRARSHKLIDRQLTNHFPSETEGAESKDHFPSETEGAESKDGNMSMDLQFSNHFPSETEGIEYEDRDVYCTILKCGIEIPKWFNHQTIENSISFWVGCRFPKFALCVVPVPEQWGYRDIIDISINGCEKREYKHFNLHQLSLFSPHQWLLQQQLNESNPTDQNHVELTCRTYFNCYSLKWWGVHIECTCPPQESDDDDVVDYWRELPFLGDPPNSLSYFAFEPLDLCERVIEALRH